MSLVDIYNTSDEKQKKKKRKLVPIVAPPPEAPKKERPVPSGGDLPTGPSMERYARATVKQIVLHFVGTDYRKVIQRLRRVIATEGVKNHAEAFLATLDFWEKEHGYDEASE